MQFQPRRAQTVQAAANPAIAQYSKMMQDSLTGIGTTIGEAGQGMRSSDVAKLMGSGVLEDMSSDEAAAAIAQVSQGDVNEQTNRNVNTLLNTKSSAEAAALTADARVDAAELLNLNQVQAQATKANNAEYLQSINHMDRVQAQEMQDAERFRRIEEAEMQKDRYGKVVSDGIWINGKYVRTKGLRQDGTAAPVTTKDYSKTLTGNEKKFFEDGLSENQRKDFMWIKERNPDFSIGKNLGQDKKGKPFVKGLQVRSGTNTPTTLSSLRTAMEDNAKRNAEPKTTAKSPVEQLVKSEEETRQTTANELLGIDKQIKELTKSEKTSGYGGSNIRSLFTSQSMTDRQNEIRKKEVNAKLTKLQEQRQKVMQRQRQATN